MSCVCYDVVMLAAGQWSMVSRCSTSTSAVFVQAAASRDMDRAERLCMVFTQFCDYNVSILSSPSDLVSGAMPSTVAQVLPGCILRYAVCRATSSEMGFYRLL